MKSKKRYTITSALPYTNGRLHIGHLAGAYIPADIYARFKRITDNDVAYICGSDEHGVAISIRAKKENKTPKEVIDKIIQGKYLKKKKRKKGAQGRPGINWGGLGGVLAASWLGQSCLASKIVPKPLKNRCQHRLKI